MTFFCFNKEERKIINDIMKVEWGFIAKRRYSQNFARVLNPLKFPVILTLNLNKNRETHAPKSTCP